MDLELTGRVGGPVAPPRTAVGRRNEYELLTLKGRYHDPPGFRNHGYGLSAAASASSEIIIGNL